MAKISELVKTYRLLSDPNAPDWNVKFIGAAVVALALVAAAGALVWSSASSPQMDAAPGAAEVSTPSEPRACTADEIAAATAAGSSVAPGEKLDAGCVVPSASA